MKIIIVILAVAALAVAEIAFADSDGDHSVRPRPEFDPLQAEILRAPRVPVDPTMQIPGAKTTTDFGRYGFRNLDEQPSVEPLSLDSVERP